MLTKGEVEAILLGLGFDDAFLTNFQFLTELRSKWMQ